MLCVALGLWFAHSPVAAQDVVPPTIDQADVTIDRGQDIVQIPSLWYQEGDEPPDSLGVVRVPRFPTDPDAVTFEDVERGFPVNLQIATFHRDGQVAEVQVSRDVLDGDVEGRLLIRPPEEDHFDIAEPYGVSPLRQEPGEETAIDVAEWYEAALENPRTGEIAPEGSFHATREVRGHLRSTAAGGETVPFFLAVSPEARPEVEPVAVMSTPRIEEPFFTPTVAEVRFRQEPSQRIEWITTTAILGGPNRADMPEFQDPTFEAFRARGDVTSTLRLLLDETRWFDLTFFGASQPTFSGDGDHHDVPYGTRLSARFGEVRAFQLDAFAAFEDSPFQEQGITTGDQRLRVLAGVDTRLENRRYRISVGPTYFRDRPSTFEVRQEARQLGVALEGEFRQRFSVANQPLVFSAHALGDQSWGYIRDAGNANTNVEGRFSLKRSFTLAGSLFEIGPAIYTQYLNTTYDEIQGFSEWSTLIGLQATTRINILGDW